MAKKAIDQFNEIEKDRLNEYIKDALQYPLRFYTLLLLAGESSVQAQKLMFDIKYSMMRSANVEIRRKLMRLLKKIIDIITSDSVIYNRLRSLALNDKLNAIKEESKMFLNYHGFNEHNMNKPSSRKAAMELLSMVLGEDAQGVAGTGLGTIGGNSPSPMQGIDSYDPIMTPMIRRFKKTKKKKG
jgi:hypothetical protein